MKALKNSKVFNIAYLSTSLVVQAYLIVVLISSLANDEYWGAYLFGLLLIGPWNYLGNFIHTAIDHKSNLKKVRLAFAAAASLYLAFLIFSEYSKNLNFLTKSDTLFIITTATFQVSYFIITVLAYAKMVVNKISKH